MQSTSHAFKKNAHEALNDQRLQKSLFKLKSGFQERRAAAAKGLPEFEQLRDQARDIKNHVLDNLDYYLERYEERVTEQGGHVHWARNAAEARDIITKICKDREAKTVTKGKSMIAEEIGINAHLENEGIEPVETDLGEYIIQVRNEPPSHIIAPAVHLSKDDVEQTFRDHHTHLAKDRSLVEAQDLVSEARGILRERFLEADIGITGANFIIAETGTSIIVTNEGNGDLTQSLPKVHVVLTSLEKVVPTLEDTATILRVLARSATGQEFSAYTTLSTGPKREGDLDGPEEYHVVLLDNGRTSMLGSEFQEMLRCIRCGACMNHCPVYASVGGHSYGWVYPGPMGSVLTPSLIGVEEAGQLPNASTFCGKCEEVCPMRIPLPKLMRHWRKREFEQNGNPPVARWALKLWGFAAKRPGLYRTGIRVAMSILGRMGKAKGRMASVPLAGGWTSVRDLPAPPGKTFQDLYRQQKAGKAA